MKSVLKIALTFAILTLSACSSTTDSPILLSPDAIGRTELISIKSVRINDLRKTQSLAKINGKELPVGESIVPGLNSWLEKSFKTNAYANKEMTIQINTLGSFVKQETMSFELESVVQWTVQIDSKRSSWTKGYQVSMREVGPLTADNTIIEKHLNTLSKQLLEKVVNDPEFKQAIYNR